MAYTRQKHQYRNAETVIGKFTASGGAASTFTRVSGSNEVSNTKMTVGTLAASIFTLTFPKCRRATVIAYQHQAATPTVANMRILQRNAEANPTAGTVAFTITDQQTGALAVPTVGDILTFVVEMAT